LPLPLISENLEDRNQIFLISMYLALDTVGKILNIKRMYEFKVRRGRGNKPAS
jgi:hypothetical protein